MADVQQARLQQAGLAALGLFAILVVLLFSRFPSILPGYPAVIVAFVLWFVLPGWFLQRALFVTKSTGLVEQAAVAFLMSLALAALPALVALRLHWSVDAFAMSYAVLASVASGISLFWRRDQGDAPPVENPVPSGLSAHAPLLLMIGIPLLAIATSPWWVGDSVSRDFDDWVYMSYVTEYIGSDALDASKPFLDTRPGQFGRMQFNGWVVMETLLAENAGVEPFDLLINYLPPIMTLLAVAAMFTLAKGLFRSTQIALLAALFVLAYGALDLGAHESYGRNVFLRIGEDKMVASFILLPLGLLLGAKFMAEPNRAAYLTLLLVIVALFVTHPLALIFLGVAMASLAVLRALVERTAAVARTGALVSLPWVLLAIGFYRWSGDGGHRVLLTNEPFRRAFHMIDVTDGLVIGSYHLFLHPFLMAAVLLAIPVWLVSRRNVGNQMPLALVLGVLTFTFVPYLATEVAAAVNEEAVYRLHWLLPVPLILAYALHQATSRLIAGWRSIRGLRVAPFVPVLGVVLVAGVALVAQEQYAIADDGAYYNRTSSSELLPWTGGSIFLGGVDSALASGSRPTESQEELFAYLRERVPPESEVLMDATISGFLYGLLYRVRPFNFRGAPDYVARTVIVRNFDNGGLDRPALDDAVRKYGIELVAVKERTLTDSALRSFAEFGARELEVVLGKPDLALRSGATQGEYWAWAFESIERERVGGQRFTIPEDISLDDPTLDFVIELAPSRSVSGDQTVRLVVSYRKSMEGAAANADAAVFNAVADVVLPGGTAAGEVVPRIRSPLTEFAPGDTYEFSVWRSPDAEADTYPEDVWFAGLALNYTSDNLSQIGDTPFYIYEVVP